MTKKQSNPPPPDKKYRPKPPPPPPGRTCRTGFFGMRETKESIRAGEDYEVYMRGYRDGRNSIKGT